MPYLSNKMQAMREMFMNVDKVEQLPSPRVLRPHLPFNLLPPQLLDTTKVIAYNLSHTRSYIYDSIHYAGGLRGSQSERCHRFLLLSSQID